MAARLKYLTLPLPQVPQMRFSNNRKAICGRHQIAVLLYLLALRKSFFPLVRAAAVPEAAGRVPEELRAWAAAEVVVVQANRLTEFRLLLPPEVRSVGLLAHLALVARRRHPVVGTRVRPAGPR